MEEIKNFCVHGFIYFEYKGKEFKGQISNFDEKRLDLEFVNVFDEKKDDYVDYCKFDYETQEIYKEAIEKIKKIFIKED